MGSASTALISPNLTEASALGPLQNCDAAGRQLPSGP